MAKPDPTKDPKFQKVVQAFLNTPHQPHRKRRPAEASPRRSNQKKDNHRNRPKAGS
jgi:hypothetical protein